MVLRFGFVLLTPLLGAAVLVTPPLVTATYSEPAAMSDPQPAAVIDFQSVPLAIPGSEPNDDDATDVYGNEVTAAVAKYKFDATGMLYELHSPQTELPRLASPKS